MPLSLRHAPLLFAALLGAGGAAVAAPQQRREAPPPPAVDQEARMQQRRPPARPEWARPAPRRSEDALSDSVRRVEQRTRGQILSAERVPYDGRNLNRIKVVDERGRVRVYMDDPQASQGAASGGQASPQAQDSDAPTRDNDD